LRCTMQSACAYTRAGAVPCGEQAHLQRRNSPPGCTELGTQKVRIYVYHIHPYFQGRICLSSFFACLPWAFLLSVTYLICYNLFISLTVSTIQVKTVCGVCVRVHLRFRVHVPPAPLSRRRGDPGSRTSPVTAAYKKVSTAVRSTLTSRDGRARGRQRRRRGWSPLGSSA
jgi:hypothetical protein